MKEKSAFSYTKGKKYRIEGSCSRFSHALCVSDLSEAGIVELSPVKDT